MNKRIRALLVAVAATSAIMSTTGQAALAQEAGGNSAERRNDAASKRSKEVIEEVVTVGSRRAERTVAESMVPIDVLSGAELESQGAPDMDDMLRTTIPSYNVRRWGTGDEASIVRPAQMRGLPADNNLVLVNGKRRHRSGVITQDGVHGPDLGSIPAMAIKQVEVLRDGASAQYGSDAVAGVLNFMLKDASEGVTLEARTGQFFKGDGELYQLSANAGFPLGQNGFANVTAQWREMAPTDTATQRTAAATIRRSGNAAQRDAIPEIAQEWGQQEVNDDWIVFLNSELEITDSQSFYFFGNVGSRSTETGFNWRNPNSQGSVFTHNFNGQTYRAVMDSNIIPNLGGQVSNCPAMIVPGTGLDGVDLDPTAVANDFAAMNSLPDNCLVYNEFMPGGFTPKFSGKVRDASGVMGIQGVSKRFHDLTYDISLGVGWNDADFHIRETVNPSLGQTAITAGVLQRAFDVGSYSQFEKSFNANFTKALPMEAFVSDLNLAFGVEWREEEWTASIGEVNSWINGPFTTQAGPSSNPNCYGDGTTCQLDATGAPIPLTNMGIGSNGLPGYSPQQAGTWARSNWAFYTDVEGDVTEKFTVGAALRYENFNTFGSTVNGKLSSRLELTENVALRASLSTGFRAPTPAQSNQTKLRTTLIDNELLQSGRIPSTNPIAVSLGGKVLQEEKATSFTLGGVFDVTETLSVTVDYFNIELTDRLATTGNLSIIALGPLTDGSCPIAAADPAANLAQCLQESGVPGAAESSAVSFFTNNFDTTTQGIDIVATWLTDFGRAGTGNFTAAWNWTDTQVDRIEDDISRNTVVNLENALPDQRGIFTYNHSVGDFGLMLRASYYGERKNGGNNGDPLFTGAGDNPQYALDCTGTPNAIGGTVYTDYCFGSDWVFDVEASYYAGENVTLVLGAQNFTDNFGPLDKGNESGLNNIGLTYSNQTPFGFDGGFAYFRMKVDF
ncbi:TonB-dependent receptor plug domain-containing protein [Woeseia oceani]|uniref:TonB-dependent receptor n=1 Tax=Woeseia oceani TaxID=1548547 RepID=A0A193LDL0_9GAMM|nr:TonB-dependent receptor [Woeseia oceani]ANO50469.1 hypothetical protein BA177_03915 [Woeseia oceani]